MNTICWSCCMLIWSVRYHYFHWKLEAKETSTVQPSLQILNMQLTRNHKTQSSTWWNISTPVTNCKISTTRIDYIKHEMKHGPLLLAITTSCWAVGVWFFGMNVSWRSCFFCELNLLPADFPFLFSKTVHPIKRELNTVHVYTVCLCICIDVVHMRADYLSSTWCEKSSVGITCGFNLKADNSIWPSAIKSMLISERDLTLNTTRGEKLADSLDIPRCFGLTMPYCDRGEKTNTCHSTRLDSGRQVIALLMRAILHR